MKPRSAEHCKNISRAHLGVKRGPISEEHKQALLQANIGRKNSEETIQKMKESKQKMRKPKSKESLLKRSLTNTGRKLRIDPITGKRSFYHPSKD